jgi:Beta-propeller repeat
MLSGLPLRFEENRGQWNPEVLYAARAGLASGHSNLFFTKHGPVFTGVAGNAPHRVNVSWLRANPSPAIEPLDRLPAHTDYFIGRSQWHTGISHYARIAYRSVYPGIDVVYYGSHDQLEYDFVLRPGADPHAIRLQFQGADRISLTGEGDLVVECAGARLVQKRPLLYQEDPLTSERRLVEGRYRLLAGSVVTVDVSHYNRSRPLVIDPVVTYATFLGGSATDQINAVTTDANGLIYVVGYTDSTNLSPTYNGVQGGNAGENDAFIAVIDPTKYGGPSLHYLTYLGGADDDAATGIAVDSKGHLYVTGTTSSMNFPVAGNAVQTALALSTNETVFNPNIFVAEISEANGLLYSTYFGGTGGDYPYGIGLDAKGNVYVGGTTQSTDFPVTSNAFAAVLWGPSDVFVVELNVNDTAALYATYIGGENADDGRGFAVSPSGLVYFAASTLSTEFPLAGRSYLYNLPGIESLVIGVMNPSIAGNQGMVYATYFGGTNLDEVRGLALDSSGNVLITGWTLSSDFPTTATAMMSTYGGAGNAFAVRVNPTAEPDAFLLYSTFIGGTGGDVGYGITSDAKGNLYVAGYTLSTDFPVTSDAALSRFGDGVEAFLVKFNPAVAGSGALEYGTYFGTTGFHVVTGVAVAPNGTIALGGYTTDALFGLGSGLSVGYQQGFGGGYSDGFVIALQ